jgi:hypothetical protein
MTPWILAKMLETTSDPKRMDVNGHNLVDKHTPVPLLPEHDLGMLRTHERRPPHALSRHPTHALPVDRAAAREVRLGKRSTGRTHDLDCLPGTNLVAVNKASGVRDILVVFLWGGMSSRCCHRPEPVILGSFRTALLSTRSAQ